MSVAPRRQAAARRAIGTLAVALAAAGSASAARASAGLPTGGPPPSPSATAAAQAALRELHFGVRLVDVPLDEAHNPRALRYIIDFLPTGSVIRRRIMIVNDEPRTAHLAVYAGAAQITAGMFIGLAGRARNELTGWITVQHPAVTLRPGQATMDLVTIAVPRDATRAEHYGVIWAQQAEPVDPAPNVAIEVVARVGIRVYLAVGPGGVPPTTFTITSVTALRPASGQPELVAGVRDTGGRAVDLNGQLRLTGGPGGSSAGPFREQRVVTLAPGQSGTVVFVLPKSLPDGPWLASVTLASGLTTASSRATVLFGARLAAADSWANAATLAWGGGMILGLVVIAAVAVARLWRPRRRASA